MAKKEEFIGKKGVEQFFLNYFENNWQIFSASEKNQNTVSITITDGMNFQEVDFGINWDAESDSEGTYDLSTCYSINGVKELPEDMLCEGYDLVKGALEEIANPYTANHPPIPKEHQAQLNAFKSSFNATAS